MIITYIDGNIWKEITKTALYAYISKEIVY